jgi:hypothetical protein
MIRLVIQIGLVFAAVVFAACGESGVGASSSPATDPSAAFRYAVNAGVAGDADHVWALVVGHDRPNDDDLRARIYERGQASRWKELPPIADGVSSDFEVSAAAFDGRPCVGMVRPGQRPESVVLCQGSSAWQDISEGSALERGVLLQLVSGDDGLLALVAPPPSLARKVVDYAVYRWRGTEWSRTGAPLRTAPGIAQLGTSEGKAAIPDLVIETTQKSRTRRTVYSLKQNRWARSGKPITNATMGPTTSGPIVDGTTTLLGVNEANTNPWRFSVYSRSGADEVWRHRALNVGRGHAQGSLYLAGDTVWAAWMESLPRRGRFPFSERVWVARVNDSLANVDPIEIHSGLSVGPGDLDIVEGAGQSWMAYMTTTKAGRFQARFSALPSQDGPRGKSDGPDG